MNNLEANLQLNINDFVYHGVSDTFLKTFAAASSDLEKSIEGEAQFFWNFLKDSNLRVHSEFFEDFQMNDGFQIVDQSGRLTYFSMNIAKLLRFDLEHVLSTPFDELFERDPFMTKRIMDSFFKIMTHHERQVFDLTEIPKHVVRQIGFLNDSYFVSFKKAYPVFIDKGMFYGFVLRLDVKTVQN